MKIGTNKDFLPVGKKTNDMILRELLFCIGMGILIPTVIAVVVIYSREIDQLLTELAKAVLLHK